MSKPGNFQVYVWENIIKDWIYMSNSSLGQLKELALSESRSLKSDIPGRK